MLRVYLHRLRLALWRWTHPQQAARLRDQLDQIVRETADAIALTGLDCPTKDYDQWRAEVVARGTKQATGEG